MYYKQTYKTSCLLDACAKICNISSREAIKLLSKLYNKDSIFSKGGYFKYTPAVRLLRMHGICPFIKVPYVDKVLSSESVPMILGINMFPDDELRPLHAVYYDGSKVWEGAQQQFIDNIDKLKIYYAIVCYNENTIKEGKNLNNYLIESICWDWDNQKKPAKITGQFSYLNVI